MGFMFIFFIAWSRYYDVFDLTQSIAKSAVTLLVPGAL